MALKLRVKSSNVTTRSGKSQRTGKDYSMRIQEDIQLEINGEVRLFPINLNADQLPHAVGDYMLETDGILEMGEYGLRVKPYPDYKLVPVGSMSNIKAA